MQAEERISGGVVISTTRKYVDLLVDYTESRRCKLRAKDPELVIGDRVTLSPDLDGEQGDSIALSPRKNLLYRRSRGKQKDIAANVDHVFLMFSPKPRPDYEFLDRVILRCVEQGVSLTLLGNKTDLGEETLIEVQQIYEKSQIPIRALSAKNERDLEEFKVFLDQSGFSLVLFYGLSGVGKSTLLNGLVPDAARETRNLSEKASQGKQTTTQARAFSFPSDSPHMLIADYPGLRNFGVDGVSRQDFQKAYPEIHLLSQHCEYRDCNHLSEHACAVKAAVAEGELPETRYRTYAILFREFLDFRDYE